MDSEHCASDFVIEAWVAKRWRRIARSGYEATARRLFIQLSYKCPAETILRLSRGSEILIKMPADGLENVASNSVPNPLRVFLSQSAGGFPQLVSFSA